MDRLKLDVVGIREVRWEEEHDFWSGSYRIINTKSNRGNAGVGTIMNKKIRQRVSYKDQHSKRIIVVKIDTKPVPTTLVQVHMPTSSADDEEIERIYEEIEDLIQYVKGDENVIVMGDRNAVVGQGREGNTVGEFRLGQRNERGSRLVEFCTDPNLVLANTWFKHHKRWLYTWTRLGDTGRYHIDFIMIRQRFRNQVLDCKTFPRADVDSDHNLLVMKCHLKLKKLKKGRNARRWYLHKL
ncbi:craniofacial development protein 2-like, partial [Anabrus simplex]|uniref:craniofacial development protein 2-like n=1 Tax=Anabrus simplex TaxID=316456 RepID=UPI0035A27D3D